MPNYAPNQLLTYGRPPPKQAHHTPFEPRPINYGTKSDTIIHEDPGKLLGDADKKYIQQVLGSSLYYARAVYDNFTRPQRHRNTAIKTHRVNHEKSSPIT